MAQGSDALDYARLGRQIALAHVGPAGQHAIAAARVVFVRAGSPVPSDHEPARVAASAHVRAGGSVVVRADQASVCVELPLRAPRGPGARAEALGLGAWAAVEAARRILGAPPLGSPPGDLIARLALDAHAAEAEAR